MAETFYEGQRIYPDDPGKPVLVWSKKRGWITEDDFNAMRGRTKEEYATSVDLLRRLNKAREMSRSFGATGFLGRVTAGASEGFYKGIGGTPGYNLDRMLLPVRSNEWIRNLTEMRQNSPTGAAVGNPTEGEGKKLESTRGVLDVGQSGEQLRSEIDTLRAAILRRTPGLSPNNPIDLNDWDPRQIPQGAYFRGPDGKVYTNVAGAGAPWARKPAKPSAATPAASRAKRPSGPKPASLDAFWR